MELPALPTEWVEADAKTGIAVTNPATGELIGYVPKLGTAETNKAIEVAESSRHAWAARTAKEGLINGVNVARSRE